MALFHIGIAVIGSPAYRRFGGEGLAHRAESGSLVPAAMLLGIAAVFAVFAAYAFVGARSAPKLPLLRTVLVLVSVLYGVHGLFVLPELVARFTGQPSRGPSNLVVDVVFLVMALPYVIGTAAAWPVLSRRSGRVA